MLDKMRKGAQHTVVKIMFFLLAGMFVVWGVGDVFRNNPVTGYVVKIGKSGVTESEVEETLRGELERYQQITGKAMTAEEIEQTGVRRYVLGNLIRDRILTMRVSDLNITGGKKDVARHIEENQVFFDESGKFDRERFKQILRANGYTEEKFANSIKKDAAVSNLLGVLAAAGVSVDSMARNLWEYRSEERVADIITIPSGLIKEVAEPAETDLVQFYQENQNVFEVPEYRAVSYITFGADKVKASINISDDELMAEYKNNLEQYKTGEARDVSQYLFTGEEEAKSAYEKISKGDVASFASNKVELGKIAEADAPVQVKDAIFSAKIKEATAPVKSDLGWHIFIVNSVEAEKVKSFDEVKKDIQKNLLDKKMSEEFAHFGNQIEDEFASGKTIEDVAKSFDLTVQKITSVDAFGKNDAGSKVEIPDAESSLPLIFGIESGVPSSLTLLSDNSTYAVFRVDSVIPKRVKALDEVKGTAIKAWKEAQKGKVLEERAKEISAKFKSGEDYKLIVRKEGLSTEENKTLSRYSDDTENTRKIPAELRRELFSVKKNGGFTSAYKSENGDFVIAKLVNVIKADPENKKLELTDIKTQLEDSMRDNIMMEYTNFLRNEYPVVVKSEALGGEASVE